MLLTAIYRPADG